MSVERAEIDLRKAEEVISRLEAQLQDVRRRVIKLRHYIELAAMYGEVGAGTSVEATDKAGNHSQERRREESLPRTVELVVRILRDAGRPMHTRELLQELEKYGVKISSLNPVTNLSGSLSRWKHLLKPSRTEGWRLIEDNEEKVDFDAVLTSDVADLIDEGIVPGVLKEFLNERRLELISFLEDESGDERVPWRASLASKLLKAIEDYKL